MAESVMEKNGATLTVKPQRRIDTATAPKLKEEIMPHLEGISELIMDFEHVEYISSAGLRILLLFYEHMQDNGGTIRLIHVNQFIVSLFELVKFSDVIPIE